MALMQLFRIHAKDRLRIPDHEISIVSFRDCAFLPRQACETCRTSTRPLRDAAHRIAVRPRRSPHSGERKLERSDAAPRGEKIAGIFVLHFRRTRGMVAGDEIKSAVAKRVPKP